MVDYGSLRKKFPAKDRGGKRAKAAAIKAIAAEYERKRAEIAARAPSVRRGFPYYMAVAVGMALVAGLAGSAIFRRGGIDVARRDMAKAEKSVENLAVALGRFRYHVGRFPAQKEGLAILAAREAPGVAGWNGPYVKRLNQDPWKRDYVYVYRGETELPVLYSAGPDGVAGTTDDVIADRAAFDAAFRDTSWTDGWMPAHLRDIVVAQDENHRRALEEEVGRILHPDVPAEGETPLADGWEIALSADGGADAWRPADIPFDLDAPGAPVAHAVAVCRVRRTLAVPASAEGKRIALRFGGICGRYEIRLGDALAASGDDAREGLEIDVPSFVRPGESHVLSAVLSRGGDGAPPGFGITGGVSLLIGDGDDAFTATTLAIGDGTARVALAAGAATNVVEVPRPRLWTPERPHLYKGFFGGRIRRYAIRTVEPGDGGAIVLNGERTQIRCVDLTLDLGLLGMAFRPEAAHRKLQWAKDCGANAVRFAGGSPSAAWRGLCDEAGLLVLDGPEFADAMAAIPRVVGVEPSWPGAEDGEALCDMAGGRTRRFWLRRAAWDGGWKGVRILGGWNRDCEEGEKTIVECASGADEAELFLNGESAGRAKRPFGSVEPFVWEAPFEPGALKVIAFLGGNYLGETTAKTAFAPAALAISSASATLPDGETAHVVVSAVDDFGTPVDSHGVDVAFSVEGPGKIVAAQTSFRNGTAAAVVLRDVGGSGLPLRVSARAAGLRPATLAIPSGGRGRAAE